MSEAPPTFSTQARCLAAVLSADVVGYSRLMGRDEAVTVRDLEAHQSAVLPIIEQHGGSVIGIAGDGIVAEFPSAVRAVECAAAIQKVMSERNADVPEDRRMRLRIGVNLGDIVDEGAHVYGDGINVAARLEPLAQPGGICISATVRDAITGKLTLPLVDLGEKSLKNIERPVRIYEIPPPGARPRRSRIGARLKGLGRAPLLFAVVVVLLVAGVAAWRFWPHERDAIEYAPAIAVLPFANAQHDANLDYLGPSVAREVSAVLATFPLLRVVSTSGLPPEKLANPQRAAQELGADYALEGGILRSGDKLRVTTQLVAAESGENVWSDSFEFREQDPIAIQEKIAQRINAAIAGVGGGVRKIEEAAAWRKPESALTEYDYYLRSQTYFLRYTPDDNQRARKIAEQGLARFPNSALLKIELAWTYMMEADTYGPFKNCREVADKAYELGREAEEASTKSRFLIYKGRELMAHAYAWHDQDFDRSVQEAQAAVAMAPYDGELKGSLAWLIANAGKLAEAVEWASWAAAHDLQKSPWTRASIAWVEYLAGRNEQTLETQKGLESIVPQQFAAVYASLGRRDEAKAAVAEFLKSGPHSILTESCWPIREPLKQKYLADLRTAGLPER